MPFGLVSLMVRVPTAAEVLSVVSVKVSEVALFRFTLLTVPPVSIDTVAPGSKLVPVRVTEVDEFVVTVFGLIAVMVGWRWSSRRSRRSR